MEDESQNNLFTGKWKFNRASRFTGAALILIFLFLIFYYLFISVPSDFPQGAVVTIPSGESLSTTVSAFKRDHIIKSTFAFQSLIILFGGEKKVIAGDYLLKNKENAIHLAWRVISGSFGMVEIKVTVPEGFSVSDIGNLLEKKLVVFDKFQFLSFAKNKEGYLFPDTYFFPPTATSGQIVLRMESNFLYRVKQFEPDIALSGHSQYDILKMASILEGEATSTTDRQIIAGILWNRIKAGLPLQIDSAFKYIIGKSSSELTLSDLKINSLYNTYLYKGLPPTPINNPGANAIYSALHPIKTSYVYFLTGTDGGTHYAKTFAEHIKNKQKYITP